MSIVLVGKWPEIKAKLELLVLLEEKGVFMTKQKKVSAEANTFSQKPRTNEEHGQKIV